MRKLQTGLPRNCGSNPSGTGYCFFLHEPDQHWVPCSLLFIGHGDSFSGVDCQGYEADRIPPSSAMDK